MTETICASFFLFDTEKHAEWLRPEEISGLQNLLLRADCYGGDGDLFFLCLQERNVLARMEREADDEPLRLLGLAFQPEDRQIWYYLPELTAALLQIFDSADYMDYFEKAAPFQFQTDEKQLAEAVRRAEREEPSLMRAVSACAEKNARLLTPHTVLFSGLTPASYAAGGVEFYRYASANSADSKRLPVPNSRGSGPALYLKPPKVFRTWTLSDRKDKVKITNIRETQNWNTLYKRIQKTWGAEEDETEE